MGVTSYGGATDPLSGPSLPAWAASVAAVVDNSDTSVNTRLLGYQQITLGAKTTNYTVATTDYVVTGNGTLTLTLPSAVGITGRQFVLRNIATTTVTVGRTSAQTIDGVAADVLIAGKGSLQVVSDGANWVVLSGQYTDESVGRRIFTWSSALAGWQLTYGDTGIRVIAVDGSWTGNIRLRRVNSSVIWRPDTSPIIMPASGATFLSVIPTGFTPTGSYGLGTTRNTSSGAVSGCIFGGGTGQYFGTITVSQGINLTAVYDTTDAWPGSLPGSASGSIPTG